MPVKIIHPLTGCRYDTILGYWMIVPEQLDNFVNLGWGVVEKGELSHFAGLSSEMTDQRKSAPYAVENGLARFKVSGPMTKHSTSMTSLFGGASTMDLRDGIKMALKDDQVRGLFFDVDSPGGTVSGTQELAHAVARANRVKPCFVHAEDQMTSAAQWVGAMGRRATCGPTARCGSVGVIVQLMDTSDRDKGMFGKPVIVSTGKYKATYAPPYTPDKIEEIKREQQKVLAVFWGEMAANRPKISESREEILTARVFVGQDALRVGLVDAVCSTDEAFEAAQKYINDPRRTPVGRGPGMANPSTAANSGYKTMLTSAQLEQLRKLPGAATATEENADVLAFNAAATLAQAVNEKTTEATTAKARVTELETALTAAKSNAAPSPMDATLLRERCENALDRLQVKVEKGRITSAQYAAIASTLLVAGSVDPKTGKMSADAKPDESMFQKVGDQFRYQRLFAALDENHPTGVLNDVSKDQPAPRATPGEATDANKDIPTLQAVNDLRERHNLPALSEKEYFEAYPEARKGK